MDFYFIFKFFFFKTKAQNYFKCQLSLLIHFKKCFYYLFYWFRFVVIRLLNFQMEIV